MSEQVANSTRKNYFVLMPQGGQVLLNVFYEDEKLDITRVEVTGLVPGAPVLTVKMSDGFGGSWSHDFAADESAKVVGIKFSSSKLDGVDIGSGFAG